MGRFSGFSHPTLVAFSTSPPTAGVGGFNTGDLYLKTTTPCEVYVYDSGAWGTTEIAELCPEPDEAS